MSDNNTFPFEDFVKQAVKGNLKGLQWYTNKLPNGVNTQEKGDNILLKILDSYMKPGEQTLETTFNFFKKNGGCINTKNIFGKTALIILAKNNPEYNYIFDLFLEIFGNDINFSLKDNDGNDALTYAIQMKNLKMVKTLCEKGVKIQQEHTNLAKNFFDTEKIQEHLFEVLGKRPNE